MDLGVRDQGYLVVGGTAGMGYEATRALAADGARYRDLRARRSESARAADAIAAEHSVQVVPVVGDVSKGVEEAERVVADTTAALGDLAGMAVTTGLSGHLTLEDATERDLGRRRPRRADERGAHGEGGAAATRRAGRAPSSPPPRTASTHRTRTACPMSRSRPRSRCSPRTSPSPTAARVCGRTACVRARSRPRASGAAHTACDRTRCAGRGCARAGHGRRVAHGRRARAPRPSRGGRRALRVPALAACRLPHRCHDQHRRRHRLLRRTLSRPRPGWRNGRRRRLKPAGSSGSVRVRIPPRARL